MIDSGFVSEVLGCFVAVAISPGHVAPPDSGVEGLDPEEGAHVPGALPNELQEQAIQEEIPERQRPEARRQTVERLVSLVVVVLDPFFDPQCAGQERF